ncbi:MAG: histone deacetylase family protein [Proteobacteria bacterium]|nr:histone deacetylase family protein [Pseudomonadota bacterium]
MAVFTDKTCALHDPGAGHPEQIARLSAVVTALQKPEFKNIDWHRSTPEATTAQLEYAHDPDYVHTILRAAPKTGYRMLDSDTILSPHSIEAALHAAGAVVAAVDHVLTGKVEKAFCAVRPPGHHAEKDKAMGFCIFSNAAIGAWHAVKAHGLKRVAIVDFDVHHGNGTENIVDGHAEFLYASTHQYPFYPGTGAAVDTGRLGNIVNVPLQIGDGSAAFRRAFTRVILPALDKFKPELMIISAGFDAHQNDPLAQINLIETDYAWVTTELRHIADEYSHSHIVSVLEGGYNLEGLASSAAAHVAALMKP